MMMKETNRTDASIEFTPCITCGKWATDSCWEDRSANGCCRNYIPEEDISEYIDFDSENNSRRTLNGGEE